MDGMPLLLSAVEVIEVLEALDTAVEVVAAADMVNGEMVLIKLELST